MARSKSEHLTDAVLAVFRANGRLIAWGDGFAAPFGLTSARWQMLGALALAERPLTAPQIAAAMGVTRQGAQKQLNLLADDGLVSREPNPNHQRSPLYQLTRRGESVYAATRRSWDAHTEQLAKSLELDDLLAAKRVLAFLADRHVTDTENDPA